MYSGFLKPGNYVATTVQSNLPNGLYFWKFFFNGQFAGIFKKTIAH